MARHRMIKTQGVSMGLKVARRLTFGLWKPNEENIGIVNDANDEGDEHDKNIADDHLWSYRQTTGHSAAKMWENRFKF